MSILVDHNGLQGFGTTSEVASMSPLDEKLAGFSVELRRCDGHDLRAMRQTLSPRGTNGPVVTILQTRKGRGVPEFEGRMSSHYLPLTESQYERAVAALDSPS